MNPRICICCGEPMAENNHGMSRNPNVCASCSSMADGIGELLPKAEAIPSSRAESHQQRIPREQVVIEWSSGRLLKRK
jgi:hypothetical protein